MLGTIWEISHRKRDGHSSHDVRCVFPNLVAVLTRRAYDSCISAKSKGRVVADFARQPYVFICYASVDRERVLSLVDRLEHVGITVWIDREGIHGGANYAQVINDAIQGAAALLLCASPAALLSRNVKQELSLGWRYEKRYLPLLLDLVTIPGELAYWLEGSQWIEVLDRPESAWLADLAKALDPLGITVQRVSTGPVAGAPRRRPLVVGREREQDALRQHLDDMLAGRGGMILVGGEAGMGKTTLVEDLSIQAEEVGCLVLWGHAYDLSVTPPYGPWLEIFTQYQTRGADLPPLPDFVGNAEELTKVGSQETLFAGVADFFRTVAMQCPLVLVLDDLHWADQASLDFFRFLARQLAIQRILLIAIYRSDELHRRHPLYPLLPLLIREADAERLEVRPLGLEGQRALIQSRYLLPEKDKARLQAYFEVHAEGNPLYAGELLRTFEEAGVLRPEQDRWILGNLDRVRVPPLLLQVIEGRLFRLDEGVRVLLQIAAVIGPYVPLELWQEVSGARDEALAAAIDQGQTAHLIEETPDGSYRFRHALLREALYEEVSALQRRRWHRQVAEAVEGRSQPDPDIIAHHFGQARDPRAHPWLVRAGERAARNYAWPVAAERLEAALELAVTPRDRAWLLYCIGRLRRWTNPQAAAASYHEGRTLALEAGDAVLAAYCLFDEGMPHAFAGDVATALHLMAAGIAEIDALPSDHLFTYPGLLNWASDSLVAEPVPPDVPLPTLNPRLPSYLEWLGFVGRLDDAVERGEAYLREADAAPWLSSVHLDQIAGDLLNGLAVVYGDLARRADQLRVLERAYAIASLRHNHVNLSIIAMHDLRGLLTFDTTNLAARRRRIEVMDHAYARAGESTSYIRTINYLVLEGRWDEARRIVDETAADLSRPHATFYLDEMGDLARLQGDSALAWSLLEVVLQDGPSATSQQLLFHLPELIRLGASLCLDADDMDEARCWIDSLRESLDFSGVLRLRPDLLLLEARLAGGTEDLPTALDHAQHALDTATELEMPQATLVAHRQLGKLLTTDRAYDRAEEHLLQALQLAGACAAPFEQALVLLAVAELRDAEGKQGEARALLAEVQAMCEPLGAKPTLDRVATLRKRLAP